VDKDCHQYERVGAEDEVEAHITLAQRGGRKASAARA
jgi:hypothetical protein